MALYTDSFSSGWATLQLEVTESTQSVSNNTTTLQCVLKIKKDKSCSSYNNGGATISMTINGSKLYSSSSFDIRSLSVGSTKTLATKTITVSHNGDGSKSVSCSASFKSGVGLGSASISKTFTCTTIPRASSVSLSASSVNIGESITANITRKSTSFTHDVRFYIGDTYTSDTFTNISTSKSFTIPTSWYSALSSSTSYTAYCKVTTKSGSTQIGDSVTTKFTINVPSNITPTVGELTLKPDSIKIGNTTYTDILVQNKNGLTATVGTCSAGTGSSISSYTFSGPGFSGTAITNTSERISSVPSYGDELTYTVTVKDKRGRTDSVSKTIQCYQYFNPSFKAGSFKSYRVTEQDDGSYLVDPNGTKLMCEWMPVIASVGGRNTCYAIVTYTSNGVSQSTDPIYGTQAVIDLGESNKTYSVTAKLVDSFGATAESTDNSEPITVNGSARIINVADNSLGLAIGKMSSVDDDYDEPNGLFECAWDARFDGDILVKDPQGDFNLLFDVFRDLMHPVGSIFITSTNTDPSATLGGTWTLFNKGFTSYAGENSEFVTAESNVSGVTCSVIRNDSTLRVRLGCTLGFNVTDTSTKIAKLNWDKIGINAISYALYSYPVGCDAGDAILLCQVLNESGEVSINDAIGPNRGNATKDATIYIDFTVPIRYSQMIDSFCNRFYWKRTK